MRARMKRKQTIRRLAIVGSVVAVIVLFVVAFYYLTLPSALDAYDGKPVSATDLAALNQESGLTLGSSIQASLISQVRNVGGSSLTSGGKPVVLFVGADYCPYCAIQRWGLILALMRFGSFTGLSYMTSNADATDWATFTFHGSSYSSSYVVFAGYEEYDRSNLPLDTVPSGYSTAYSTYGSGYPFLDFAGTYVIAGALLPSGVSDYLGYLNSMVAGQSWAQINAAVSNSTNPLGNLIRGDANVITAIICKVTSGAPSSVCQQQQISGLTISLTAFDGAVAPPGTSGISSYAEQPFIAVPSGSVEV